MGNEILTTRRLLLREMTDEDFPALCRMLQDPEVMYAYEHAFPEGSGCAANRSATPGMGSACGRW